jgi:hypothetical protein
MFFIIVAFSALMATLRASTFSFLGISTWKTSLYQSPRTQQLNVRVSESNIWELVCEVEEKFELAQLLVHVCELRPGFPASLPLITRVSYWE